MTEHRFIDLETRLAYQDDAVNQLSDVIARQARQMDALEAALRTLIERVNTLAQREPGKSDPVDDVPPHY